MYDLFMSEIPGKKDSTTEPAGSNMIGGFAVLLLFLFAGEVISGISGIPVPGNVIGMILLAAAILTGVVKLKWVDKASGMLLKHLGLFFVPPGVGLILYFDLISRQWLPIVVAMIVSTFAVLAVSGFLCNLLEREEDR